MSPNGGSRINYGELKLKDYGGLNFLSDLIILENKLIIHKKIVQAQLITKRRPNKFE